MSATTFPNGISFTKRKSGIGQQNIVKRVKAIRINHSDGTGENDTGFDLPSFCIVDEVFVRVITPEVTGTTKTINVGILSSEAGGDADGYLAGVSVATGGVQIPSLSVTETVGVNETYISAVGNTYGVLLGQLFSALGTDVLGNTGYVTLLPLSLPNGLGSSISWTPGSADFAELSADIYIFYREVV